MFDVHSLSLANGNPTPRCSTETAPVSPRRGDGLLCGVGITFQAVLPRLSILPLNRVGRTCRSALPRAPFRGLVRRWLRGILSMNRRVRARGLHCVGRVPRPGGSWSRCVIEESWQLSMNLSPDTLCRVPDFPSQRPSARRRAKGNPETRVFHSIIGGRSDIAGGEVGRAQRFPTTKPRERDIALQCPGPRSSERNDCAAARGADGAARRPC